MIKIGRPEKEQNLMVLQELKGLTAPDA